MVAQMIRVENAARIAMGGEAVSPIGVSRASSPGLTQIGLWIAGAAAGLAAVLYFI
ncbi:MAG: hypothetical protein KF723_20970 [Rhizobiaceae bacterium]|nr:hypothetical protein [Rhizobiaceae bacterium]